MIGNGFTACWCSCILMPNAAAIHPFLLLERLLASQSLRRGPTSTTNAAPSGPDSGTNDSFFTLSALAKTNQELPGLFSASNGGEEDARYAATPRRLEGPSRCQYSSLTQTFPIHTSVVFASLICSNKHALLIMFCDSAGTPRGVSARIEAGK